LSDNASYVEQAIMLDCEGIVAKQSAEPIQLVWLNSSLAQLHGATYIRGFHNQALLIEGCIETAALRARCVGQVTTMYV
ncbi:hypothetical protein, partial [Vibrio vulnificus]|uniref:hypothetical protein n=1 Tax=Vibrio vulnificus TaxID=672 RepID=UPI001E4194FC